MSHTQPGADLLRRLAELIEQTKDFDYDPSVDSGAWVCGDHGIPECTQGDCPSLAWPWSANTDPLLAAFEEWAYREFLEVVRPYDEGKLPEMPEESFRTYSVGEWPVRDFLEAAHDIPSDDETMTPDDPATANPGELVDVVARLICHGEHTNGGTCHADHTSTARAIVNHLTQPPPAAAGGGVPASWVNSIRAWANDDYVCISNMVRTTLHTLIDELRRHQPTPHLPGEKHPGLAWWRIDGQHSSAAHAITNRLEHAPGEHRTPHPYTLYDWVCCEKLLRTVPTLRDDFHLMAAVSPQWAALLNRWDDLVASIEQEAPGHLAGMYSHDTASTETLLTTILNDTEGGAQ